uniref:Uncharacterized protein n=1 Tax=Oryza glumipatula TaxID=40148 RepID=A0A0D9Z9C3_9ORYZ
MSPILGDQARLSHRTPLKDARHPQNQSKSVDSSDSALSTQKLSHLRGKKTAPNLALQQVHIVTGHLKHR